MEVVGIVCEFNPLHKGHEHLIKQAKEIGDKVICIMSGCFVERGSAAIVNPYIRAKCAIKAGADLVVELPAVYALSSGEYFAYGAVNIAKLLGVTKLMFGMENPSVRLLNDLVDSRLHSENDELKTEMKEGLSYARALTSSLISSLKDKYEEIFLEDFLSKPNNKLSLDYLFWIKKLGLDIVIEPINRIDCLSASEIRNNFSSSSPFMPAYSFKTISDELSKYYVRENELNAILLNSVNITSLDSISNCPDCAEGLENKVKKEGIKSTDINELIESIVSSRYTRARIKRLLLETALNLTKELQHSSTTSAKVLAVKKESIDLLNNPCLIKNKDDENLLYKDNASFIDTEKRCYKLYSIITHNKELSYYSKLQII